MKNIFLVAFWFAISAHASAQDIPQLICLKAARLPEDNLFSDSQLLYRIYDPTTHQLLKELSLQRVSEDGGVFGEVIGHYRISDSQGYMNIVYSAIGPRYTLLPTEIGLPEQTRFLKLQPHDVLSKKTRSFCYATDA